MATPEAVLKEFEDNNFKLEDATVGDACAAMGQSFGLTAQELVESWEVFYLNLKVKTNNTLTKGALENFRKHLERNRVEAFKKKQSTVHFYTKDDLEDANVDEPSTPWKSGAMPNGGLNAHTPAGKQGRFSEAPSTSTKLLATDPGSPVTPLLFPPSTPSKTLFQATPTSAFKQRKNSGTVQMVFNKELDLQGPEGMEVDGQSPCEIEATRSWPTESYRYMYDRVEDKANALEKRLLAFGALLAAAEDCSTVNQVYAASQDTVTVVGRICCDTEGGRINEQSVLLEGSQEHSNGERVKLDLRNVSSFSIFPGQIVGVEGQNPSGHCLVASKLFEALPPPRIEAAGSTDANAKPRGRPPSMMVAAGPYTAADNLAYEPLEELLEVAKARRPDVLLLMGPFVDREHPHVRQGTMDAHVDDVYTEQIQKKVEAFCEEVGPAVQVVVVPSVRDSHHDAVFPQPPFPSDWKDPGREITFLSNPGVFSVNGVRVAVMTVDVLKHLSSEEASRVAPGTSSDRMARLAGHILGQRSFYPLFPPALGTPLDLSLAPSALELSVLPDILVLPSDLAPVVKVLPAGPNGPGPSAQPAQVFCVNPGRLSKGTSGGTFSYIQSTASQEADGRMNPTKVEIIRI